MADLHRPLADMEFVAFDLETTGLWPIACRIVEFGAVRFRLTIFMSLAPRGQWPAGVGQPPDSRVF